MQGRAPQSLMFKKRKAADISDSKKQKETMPQEKRAKVQESQSALSKEMDMMASIFVFNTKDAKASEASPSAEDLMAELGVYVGEQGSLLLKARNAEPSNASSSLFDLSQREGRAEAQASLRTEMNMMSSLFSLDNEVTMAPPSTAASFPLEEQKKLVTTCNRILSYKLKSKGNESVETIAEVKHDLMAELEGAKSRSRSLQRFFNSYPDSVPMIKKIVYDEINKFKTEWQAIALPSFSAVENEFRETCRAFLNSKLRKKLCASKEVICEIKKELKSQLYGMNVRSSNLQVYFDLYPNHVNEIIQAGLKEIEKFNVSSSNQSDLPQVDSGFGGAETFKKRPQFFSGDPRQMEATPSDEIIQVPSLVIYKK